MMRRIDRELDLPSHIARKIKARFEKLRKEKEESDRIIQGLQDSITKMREYLEKVKTEKIPSIEDRLTAIENDRQTIKDSLETISDAMLQLNKRLMDLDSRLKEVEEKLASKS